MPGFDLRKLVDSHLRSAKSSWSIGAFGAIAEFHRDAHEPADFGALSVVTPRGAIAVRLADTCRALAYELLSVRADLWLHGVALCLPVPEARGPARTGIAALGPDRDALRARDRDALLFDLGLGLANCEFCVRTADSGLADALRAAEGTALLANAPLVDALKRASPHRVMRSGAGRIEVFQDIAAEGARSPSGPHTHLLPRFLRQARTHTANIAIPQGWLPCLSLYPPNPVQDERGERKPFDRGEWAAFEALLERFGDSLHLRVKRRVIAAVRAAERPGAHAFANRRERAACRIALRQLRQTDGASAALAAWRDALDAAAAAGGADARSAANG